jgi:hypothetical protein
MVKAAELRKTIGRFASQLPWWSIIWALSLLALVRGRTLPVILLGVAGVALFIYIAMLALLTGLDKVIALAEDAEDDAAALEATRDLEPTTSWEDYLEERGEGCGIVVNARRRRILGGDLHFNNLVALAFPHASRMEGYTMFYRRAAEEERRQLRPGELVQIEDGMIFDITASTPGESWRDASR